ncbi:MAG: hypothetical protein BGO78_06485 [Chloroflexi bacterium 44-23]|nr:MAG: hypothetical protein BGO78_06485 [Chloroflexi bacterium 44-23]
MIRRHPRLEREEKTIDLMVDLYCREQHHSNSDDCEECRTLKSYAHLRLAKCPYQEYKTTCANCQTHCYKRSMRDQMRVVMRYAGPRMLWRHPVYTILHLLDGFRKPVSLTQSQKT